MAKSKEKWIQSAIKHPGSLTAKAEKAGAITKDGTIKQSYLNKPSKNATTQKQKNLAKTLGKLRKGK